MVVGYSGTPLVKKLGINANQRVAFINEPESFRPLLVGIAPDLDVKTTVRGKKDLIVAFFVKRSAFTKRIEPLEKAIFSNGSLWVAWPKRASKVPTDMTEDVIREVILPRGLVDVKVCAIDETWSGLKIVWRKDLRSD